MHCTSCSNSVKSAVETLSGFKNISIDLKSQLVSITGSTAPSQIVKTIRGIGKDAILRGAGGPNSAAVAILESHDPKTFAEGASSSPVMGLTRIVSVGEKKTLFDITLSTVPVGVYHAAIRTSGDISNGAMSAGPVFCDLGEISVEKDQETGETTGQGFVTRNLAISDLIGRSISVSKKHSEVDLSSLVGVVARSAGIWQNDKTVCSCSGKTVWQERQDAVKRGVV